MYFSIENRVEGFKKFYNGSLERPLLGFFIGSEYPLMRYKSMQRLPENRPLVPEDFNVTAFAADCAELFEKHEKYGGDFIWSASAFWGIPWMEVLLGMDIYANHETGSLYARMPKDSIINGCRLSEENPWANLCIRFLKELSKVSSGRFPLATTRMRGVSDLLASIYGEQELIYEMADNPEAVHKKARQITSLFLDFARLQLAYIPEFHSGIGSFYYNCWAPSGTVWHQEDAAAILSPELYKEFIRPYDIEITETLSSSIMHQHPTGYMPYNEYADMKFSALEMHVDKGGASAEQLSDVYSQILLTKPLIIWGELSQADMDFIFSRLPANRLAVMCMVDTIEQAQNIWFRYVKRSHQGF